LLASFFGLIQYSQIKNLPVHECMNTVSETIWETCKTYLFQQGKFLIGLWLVNRGLHGLLLRFPERARSRQGWRGGSRNGHQSQDRVDSRKLDLGILGSYGVAWFGIRINTKANSRSAFSSLKGTPLECLPDPDEIGHGVGLLLVSVELFFMIVILTLLPREVVGPCFIDSRSANRWAFRLRIAGGIFTKIADIGSDLMKIVFHLPEDDPKNPA